MQVGRGRENEFYTPVRARRGKRYMQKQQRVQQSNVSASDDKESSEGRMEISGENDIAQRLRLMGLVPFGQCCESSSNLERLLGSTTPVVISQFLSQTTMRGFRTYVDYQHYFTLADLWDSFNEWSAYGAGVPLLLDGRDSGVVQYYVPYLSAIQLYGKPESRQANEDSDCSDSRAWSSDGSSDDNGAASYRGQLLFQYLEQESPYYREPLSAKIAFLAKFYPALKTLRSCDLSAHSWISVAWYPIYGIPTGPARGDLEACFLTYHHLSTPMDVSAASQSAEYPKLVGSDENDGVPKFTLPAFGLAVYKFRKAAWIKKLGGGRDCPVLSSLIGAACNWVSLAQVFHPDFRFFAERR